ncbi:MAG: hypothetical protein E6J78_08175 [Deltaproteobacteria bacterium]|nr:MAG: hypothetical protein E6J78_08175 [Deltaproteobacteria bacterium]
MSGTAVKALRLFACVLSVSLAAGCGDACRTLASQICQCLPDDGSRAACNQRAKESEANFSVRPADEKFCQQQLDSHACDCNQLNTPEGKVGCGLAYIAP